MSARQRPRNGSTGPGAGAGSCAACFFLLETLATLAAPSVGWAMMGPGQPEFTRSGGSPDLVNLVNLTTGDFTCNAPALEGPGPERSRSLPLTYWAGIKLAQEASWVGLGWSLNAGAIARSLNGYPDDANGELMKSPYNQQLTRGWTGGVPGVLQLGWDVNTGHSGSASLLGLGGLGWSGGGISSGELVGVHASKEGVTADPIGTISAALTIATLGTAGSLVAMGQAAAAQIGQDVVTGVAASVLLGRPSSTGGALASTAAHGQGRQGLYAHQLRGVLQRQQVGVHARLAQLPPDEPAGEAEHGRRQPQPLALPRQHGQPPGEGSRVRRVHYQQQRRALRIEPGGGPVPLALTKILVQKSRLASTWAWKMADEARKRPFSDTSGRFPPTR